MSDSKERICITRLIKNTRYLVQIASELLKDKNLDDLISLQDLALLHTVSDPAKIIEDQELVSLLSKIIPPTSRTIFGTLFSGTVYFVRLIFNTQTGQFSVSSQDMRIAQIYSKLAIRKISRYASQYGYNNVNVSDRILEYRVNLQYGKSYNDDDTDKVDNLRIWMKEIIAQCRLPTNSTCLVFLNPASQGIVNTKAPASGMWSVGGYHDYVVIPYCFCNVFGQNFTIHDMADYYAQVLSHEMAEMVVDPHAKMANPEVCDSCSINCGQSWRDFFGNNAQFIGGTAEFPPRFDYEFFINSIARPACISSNVDCLLPGFTYQYACDYSPP